MSGRSIPAETKVQTVLSWLRKEELAGTLSRRYQVFELTLYNYRNRFLEERNKRLGGKTGNCSDTCV